MKSILIDQKVYLKPINNAAKCATKLLEEYEVKSVGNKYFYVWQNKEDWTIKKFNIETLRQATECPSNYQLYFSKQEIQDEKETGILIKNIREKFSLYGKVNLSLEQLRQIWEIIK